MGKTLEPKLEEMDRRQMEKMERLQAQQKAQRTAKSNEQKPQTNGSSTGSTQPQVSKEEAKRAKSKDRFWNMNDTVHVAERQRFRSASPDHPGLSPRVRAIPPPNGTIRAEEWAPAHAPPDPMYDSSGLNTTPASSKAGDSAASKADSSSKHSSEEKQQHGGFMNKLKKKMGAS